MKIILAGLLVLAFSQLGVAQDSPMSADPGSPPPPQGWSGAPPENGGIHLPAKKRRRPYKIKLQPMDPKTAPQASPPAAIP